MHGHIIHARDNHNNILMSFQSKFRFRSLITHVAFHTDRPQFSIFHTRTTLPRFVITPPIRAGSFHPTHVPVVPAPGPGGPAGGRPRRRPGSDAGGLSLRPTVEPRNSQSSASTVVSPAARPPDRTWHPAGH
eukprot:768278-Hanusia_phi.AAC.2